METDAESSAWLFMQRFIDAQDSQDMEGSEEMAALAVDMVMRALRRQPRTRKIFDVAMECLAKLEQKGVMFLMDEFPGPDSPVASKVLRRLAFNPDPRDDVLREIDATQGPTRLVEALRRHQTDEGCVTEVARLL